MATIIASDGQMEVIGPGTRATMVMAKATAAWPPEGLCRGSFPDTAFR
jgi:hypothetical protein